ncbi:MAG TPA: helix-turn-helix transcriptional regulator [Pseudonocardiaceae bacterium]|nr:helix-turn-helix transcriptional regulator [Pseudonocardiaceae bacterium]
MTTVEQADLRRSELGAFLKAHRAKVQPQDVGLPPGTRRRTSGLRREEVALLAGVGVTWYTWLEQGRPINASGQVLDAVARTLLLDTAERRHLYQLAEATPMRGWEASSVIPEAVHAVLRSLNPMPAVLVNGLLDVLAYNDAHENMFWDWHSGPCVHRNLLWCCVTEPQARRYLVNYDDEVRYLVARVRADYAAHVGEPEWEEDIRRLLEFNDEFAEIWAEQEVAEPMVRTRTFRLPRVGELTVATSELHVAACPGLRIQVYTPADERSAVVLHHATKAAGHAQ